MSTVPKEERMCPRVTVDPVSLAPVLGSTHFQPLKLKMKYFLLILGMF